MPTGQFPLIYNKYQSLIQNLLRKVPTLRTGYWVMTKGVFFESDWEQVLVLADNNTKIPLTADYDLFSVSPHLSAFSQPKKPTIYGAYLSVKESLGQRERRNSDPQYGVLNSFTASVISDINTKIKGQKVVHHGAEVDNPVTELDFPITVFTPWGSIFCTESKIELEMLVRDILRLGYVFYANRAWTQAGRITSTSNQMRLDCSWNDRIHNESFSTFEALSVTDINSFNQYFSQKTNVL